MIVGFFCTLVMIGIFFLIIKATEGMQDFPKPKNQLPPETITASDNVINKSIIAKLDTPMKRVGFLVMLISIAGFIITYNLTDDNTRSCFQQMSFSNYCIYEQSGVETLILELLIAIVGFLLSVAYNFTQAVYVATLGRLINWVRKG